jgi:hypothetical protein
MTAGQSVDCYAGRLRLGSFRASAAGFTASTAEGKRLGTYDNARAATAAIVDAAESRAKLPTRH